MLHVKSTFAISFVLCTFCTCNASASRRFVYAERVVRFTWSHTQTAVKNEYYFFFLSCPILADVFDFFFFFYFNQFIYSRCTLGFFGLHLQRFAPRFVFLAFAHSFAHVLFEHISGFFCAIRIKSWENISYSNFYNRKNVCFSCLFSFFHFFLHWDCANSWYHIYMAIDFSLINLALHFKSHLT